MRITKITMLLCLFALSSCLEPSATSTSNTTVNTGDGSSSGDGTGSGGGGSSDSGSGPNTGGSGVTCYGNEQDGQGEGFDLRIHTFKLAGQTEWKPWSSRDNINNLGKQAMWNSVDVMANSLETDARLRVRLKLHEQPKPLDNSEEYCYNRTTGGAGDAHLYTKIKLTLQLRDVICPNNKLDQSCYLGEPYEEKEIGPIQVDQCSRIVDFNKRNNSTYGTVVTISEEVMSDNDCQTDPDSSHYCGSEETRSALRKQSCWKATMQISTDYTQDFK